MLYPAKKNRTVSTPLLRKIVAVLIGFLGFTSSREQRSQGIFQFQRLPKLLNQSHQIQAFEHRVDSAEEAHEIGMQLVKEILGGKYEFVLSSHIDKGHIYKYLIFNAVSFTDHTHYHSNKRNYYEMLWVNDKLCREHGLSVVVHGSDKGKSYIEH